jgi:hypothetical protein
MFIKPVDSLEECLFPTILLGLHTQIGSHGKPVRNSAEQIDLERLLGLNENTFGFVAQFGGEYRVCFSSRNG